MNTVLRLFFVPTFVMIAAVVLARQTWPAPLVVALGFCLGVVGFLAFQYLLLRWYRPRDRERQP